MSRTLLPLLSLAVATALPMPNSASAQTPTQPGQTPEMVAGLAAPAPLPSLPAELLTSSSVSASLSAEPAAAVPPVSSQFEAVFAVPCYTGSSASHGPSADSGSADGSREPCMQYPSPTANPYARFLDSLASAPLTPAEKGFLALRNFDDPGNLGTIANTAAFTIATNSHTPFGPGGKGFAKDIGYSLAQDATGEFFGTFLIPSLAHEDPHYHRMPNASIRRRIFHAISRTVVAQSDSGRPMPNLSCLLTYPISAEFSNLYVPGTQGNGVATAQRVLTGYATDPIDNLITEFLPDVARRIHVHVIFAQRILNQVAGNQVSGNPIAQP